MKSGKVGTLKEKATVIREVFMCNNFKITDFAAIQMAVDACAAAGGGTVLIPEGEWHTGPIRLKSHVHKIGRASCRERV